MSATLILEVGRGPYYAVYCRFRVWNSWFLRKSCFPSNQTGWEKYNLNGIYRDMNLWIRLSLFGWKKNILYKQHIVPLDTAFTAYTASLLHCFKTACLDSCCNLHHFHVIDLQSVWHKGPSRSNKNHIEAKHLEGIFVSCDYWDKTCSSRVSLANGHAQR